MRILLTGSKGQLGQSIRKRLPEDWELIATDSKTLDITDHEAVLKMVESFQPDAVVNTAAYMAVGKYAQPGAGRFCRWCEIRSYFNRLCIWRRQPYPLFRN